MDEKKKQYVIKQKNKHPPKQKPQSFQNVR